MKVVKKNLYLCLFCIFLFLVSIVPVDALTVWRFEDWQTANDYGYKTKKTSNITNLKGGLEDDGMKVGPFNKASKARIKDGITEEVYVGLDLENYQETELFELSIAINQLDGEQAKYLTEAVVMTQKSGNKFVLTAGWTKKDDPIATIDANGVYTYRWDFKQEKDNKIKVRFTVLDYGKELGTTDYVELAVDNPQDATDVRYLWACNIKAAYGIDIYTTLPVRDENPNTSDIHLFFWIGVIAISGLGIVYSKKKSFS